MKPQKAKHFYLEAEKKNPHFIGKQYAVFQKHDGWYGYMDGDDCIRSRNMREIPSLKWMSDELRGTFEGRLIFEIEVNDMPLFSDLNGYLNRHAAAKRAHIRVHDHICVGQPDMQFSERINGCLRVIEDLPVAYTNLATMLSINTNYQQWQSMAQEQWALGNEGIIMKDLSAPYSAGSRIGSLLKIKEDITLNCTVIGIEEGLGKYEDMLGSLVVVDDDGNEHKVGGMTDDQRQGWWYDPRQIVGKIAEIKAMKRLPNGALREPRFKAIRYDLV